MDFSYQMSQVLKSLNSGKAAERKKTVLQLADLLQNDDFIDFDWDPEIYWNLYDVLLNFILEEAKRFANINRKNAKEKGIIDGCLLNAFKFINFSKIEKPTKDVLDLFFETLRCHEVKLYFCNPFLVAFNRSIVTSNKFKGNMAKDQWTDFYELLQSLYFEDSQYIDKFLVIQTLSVVLKSTSLISVYLRTDTDFLIHICASGSLKFAATNYKYYFLAFIKYFLNQIVEDCRLLCCRVSEIILPNLLTIYEKKYEEINGPKSILFDLLLLQVRIHHPKGALKNSDLAYAGNWNKWTKHLNSIYEIAQVEIDLFQSRSSFYRNSNIQSLWDNLLQLVCQVFVQIRHVNHLSANEQSEKRRCYETDFAMFMKKLEKPTWTWLFILAELIKNYTETFSSDEIKIIRDHLIALHSDHNERFDPNLLKQLSSNLAALVENGDIFEPRIIEILWQNSLKCADVNIDLLNSLLNSKLVAEHLIKDALKKLYVVDDISLNEINLKLLASFRNCLNFENVDHSFREDLLNWILKPRKKYYPLTSSMASQLVVSLILRNRLVTFDSNCVKSDSNGFENSIFTLALENVNPAPHELFDNAIDTKTKHLVHSKAYGYLIDEKLRSEYKTFTITKLLNEIIFLTKLSNEMYNAILIDDENVEDILQKYLATLLEMMASDVSNESQEILKLCQLFESFFGAILEVPKTKIFSLVDVSIYRKLISIFESGDIVIRHKDLNDSVLSLTVSQKMDTDENVSFGEKHRQMEKLKQFNKSLKISIIRSLTYCCVLDINQSTPNLEIVEWLVAFFQKKIHEDSTFIFFENFIEIFTANKIRNSNVVQKMFNLILKHFDVWHQNDYIMTSLMKSTRNIIPMLYENKVVSNVQENFYHLLETCQNIKDNYDFMLNRYLIQSVIVFIKLNKNVYQPEFQKWIQIILSNSDYVCVHITIANGIAELFGVDMCKNYAKNVNLEFLHNLFDELTSNSKNTLKNFESDQDGSNEEDVFSNTINCIVLKHTKILLANRNFINDSLMNLMTFLRDGRIKEPIRKAIQKCLKIVKNSINLKRHLKFLYGKWVQMDPSSLFPFELFDCTDDVCFYKCNLKEILVIMFSNFTKEKLETIFNSIGSNLKDILSENFALMVPTFIYYKQKSRYGKFKNNELENWQRILKIVNQTLDNRTIMHLISHKFSEIFINLMKSFRDDDEFFQYFDQRLCFNQKCYLFDDDCFIDKKMLKLIFLFLEEKIIHPKTLVKYLCESNKYVLGDILHNIKLEIYDEQYIEVQIRYYHFYVILIEFLTDNTRNMEVIDYVQREIINVSLNRLKYVGKLSKIFVKMVCKCLKIVFDKRSNDDVCKGAIQILTSGLESGYCAPKHIMSLIKVLLEKFRDNIIELSPFPNTEVFKDLNLIYNQYKYQETTFELWHEIGCFLKSDTHSSSSLRFLNEQIYEKKVEFNELLTTRPKLVKKLINRLIETATQSSDDDVRIEVLKCFGEIGPNDLFLEIIDSNCKISNLIDTLEDCSDKYDVVVENLICYSINVCVQHLSSSNTELIKAAKNALQQIVCNQLFFQMPDVNIDNYAKIYLNFLKQDIEIPCDKNLKFFKNAEPLFVDELWYPINMDHSTWMQKLVTKFLQSGSLNFFQSLEPICHWDVKYAEEIFYFSIVILLMSDQLGPLAVEKVKQFFQLYQNQGRSSDSIAINQSSIQCMLTTVHLIQNISCSFERNLNFVEIANGAYSTKSYFSAIYYLELWCEEVFRDYDYNYFEGNKISFLYENKGHSETNRLIKILKKSYQEIGDSDNVIGCDSVDMSNIDSILEHDTRLRCWDRVLLQHDINLHTSDDLGLSEALSNLGLYNIALNIHNDDRLNEFDYECAWRLEKWSISNRSDDNEVESFSKCHYFSLKYLVDGDSGLMQSMLSKMRNITAESLKMFSFNCPKIINSILFKCLMTNQIERFYNCIETQNTEILLKNWSLNLENMQFDYIEPILSQRLAMLNSCAYEDHVSERVSLSFKLLKLARIEKNDPVAIRVLNSLSKIAYKLPAVAKHVMTYEKAQIRWNHDKNSAKLLLSTLLKNEEKLNLKLRVDALKLFGQWMCETSAEHPQVIIQKYLKKPLQLLANESGDYCREIADIHDALAKFADLKYRNISSYIKSSNFSTKKNLHTQLEQQKDTLCSQMNSTNTTNEFMKSVYQVKLSNKMTEEEIERFYDEEEFYQNLALFHYGTNLCQSDAFNLRMFRFFSLWLSNKTTEIHILDIIKKIPSYKFIPLLPQLIAQLNNQTEFLSSRIIDVIQKCAKDHPHHTLPILLATYLLHEDIQYTNETIMSRESHMIAADKIITNLSNDSRLNKLIQQMQSLYRSLIQLAYIKPESTDKIIAVLNSLKEYDLVQVPTLNLQVEKTCDYKNIVSIVKYNPGYLDLRGINRPKKITCRCSNGQLLNQLLKGKDDLRQDAVMQQIFSVLNDLLSKDKSTCGLTVRGYKVVPLSQRCGIVEWCENTMTLASYLLDAHGSKVVHDYRKQLEEVVSAKNQKKLETFQQICSKIRPKLHEMFLKMYKNHKLWYERRQSYIKNVAASSMIGHIIGLGDRHLSNILIDTNTAEVVHIDFGLAFELARALKIPEKVPFRLTREIESPMGVLGVQGSFKMSCEKTLSLLTKNSDIILSFLEVFLYDPLYSWMIISNRTHNVVKNSEFIATKTNNLAERALLRIREKLALIDDGFPLTIETQVQKLIQESKDPLNLSCIYYGWLPFL